MPYRRDRRLCLTCGGPAALCAASDRCVAIDHPGVQPPRLEDERRSRTQPTVTSLGWQARAALTAAVWLPGAFAATRFTATGRPLLVFVGVPYAAAAAAFTWRAWQAHRVDGP